MTGTLYICPTPIGNLEDITIRTLETLKKVDLVAAEDTRHTLGLLNHFEIKKPLTSYHEHNKHEKGNYLVDKLLGGEDIALVSDAGMPGISDPGEEIIKEAIEAGIDVVALPGPTASIMALVVSGLATSKFVFEGFLSSKKRDRKRALESLKNEERTIILYESPRRIKGLLEDIADVLGDRKVSLARELTKRHEEINRGTATEVLELYREREEVKGEIVLIVEGNPNPEDSDNEITFESIKDHIIYLIESGMDKKEAIKAVAKARKLPKNEVYQESLDI
jgi:16S rRNA (cytidine1402-2'-O)-methyltransferase